MAEAFCEDVFSITRKFGSMNVGAVGVVLVVVAFGLGGFFSSLARKIAPRFGLVDRPGGRKAHQSPTPLGGGVAIWLTTITTVGLAALIAWLFGPSLPTGISAYVDGAWSKSWPLLVILSLATVVMVMGLIDDRFGLDWRLRLGSQFLLATIFVLFGEQVTIFQAWRWPTAILTVFWVVGLTNSFNFLDNMDGLAASVGLIASLLFVGAQVAIGSLFVPGILLVLIGALAGFLLHNRPPAKLFMGDAGSNFLGFMLGTLTVAGTFTREGYSPFGVLAPLLVMAVPLYDTTSVILIRLREGRSPFQADRSHFSHRLVDRGLTPPRAVATIDLVTMAAGLGALLLHRLTSPIEAGVVIGQAACLLGVVALLEVSTSRPEQHVDVQAKSKSPSSPALEEPGPVLTSQSAREEAGPDADSFGGH